MDKKLNMKKFKSLTGSEKLAILVMSIGLEASKEALKGLKPQEISKVIVDVSRLGKIPKETVTQVFVLKKGLLGQTSYSNF